MESEGRLLAIHCDWEHWRRHATQFPTARTLRRCRSLTLLTDDEEEDEPFDSDFGTEPGDWRVEALGATGRLTEWDSGPGGIEIDGTYNSGPGGIEIDGAYNDNEDEERGMPCGMPMGGTVEKVSGAMQRQELEIPWLGIGSYSQLQVAQEAPPVLSREEKLLRAKYSKKPVPSLHDATTTKKLLQFLKDPRVRVNELQPRTLCTPIHSFIQRRLSDRVEMILTLLTSGRRVDVNLTTGTADRNTPLHLAAGFRDEECVKLLLAFGADPLASNSSNETPHDITTSFQLKAILQRSTSIASEEEDEGVDNPGIDDDQLSSLRSCCTALEMEEKFNELLHSSQELNANDAFMAMLQKQEVAAWRKTSGYLSPGIKPDIKPGLRILFLDGGGIRGLAQIDMLMEIERRTGQKIVDMFDWIVGTSTGGIVALGLVYGKKDLSALRDMYFRKKEKLFGGKLKIQGNTAAMEALTKESFEDQLMSSVTKPKVLISAVDLSDRTLPVVFFNNFDGSERKRHLFHTPVWKVARATSAAPTVFESLDKMYVDGGVKANNPAEFAMTEIREYYHKYNGGMPPISFVVSVGTGRSKKARKGQYKGDNILAIGSLMDLLVCAISDSEEVAGKFDSQCCHLQIPHYRLNPKLSESIDPTETNTSKLVNMLYDTRCYLSEQDSRVLRQITDAFEKFEKFSK